ncbi:hypothetical protein HpMS107_51470 [Helicobacter pylori]
MSYSIEELEHILSGFEVKIEEISAAEAAHLDDMPDPADYEIDELDAWEEKRYWYQEMRKGLMERRQVLVDMLLEQMGFFGDTNVQEQDAEDFFSNEEVIAEYESHGGGWTADGDPTDRTLWDECCYDWSLENMDSLVENGLL